MASLTPPPSGRFEIGGPHDRGLMRLRILPQGTAPTVVLTKVIGHASTPIVNEYLEHLGPECARGKVEVFHDWYDVTGYDTEARKALTEWNLAHQSSVVQVHMLVKSKVVAMGVSVASVVAGRDFAVYSDRARFDNVLALRYPAHRQLF
jgi:hypothetical protein